MMLSYRVFLPFLMASALMLPAHADEPAPADGSDWQCPAIFQHEMKQLHSSKVLNLCDVVGGKPVLLVNTASHCGFYRPIW